MNAKLWNFAAVAPVALVLACRAESDQVTFKPLAMSFAHSEWSEPVNLGAPVNSDGVDQDPALTPDELSLYFASDRPGGYGIWVSHRDCRDCPWQTPVKLQLAPDVFQGGLGPTQAVGGPALSPDGHLLFFSQCTVCDANTFPGPSDIYVARRAAPSDDFGWGPAVPLGPDVNTSADEDQPAYLQDADDGSVNLYFRRTEPGSSRFDIYAAPITRDGDTRGPAVLVSELSLPNVNDLAPALRADGREIVFQSNRPGGLGRADLWVSTRRSAHDPWSTPLNVGAPVNTSSLEIQPSLSHDGRTLLFASDRPGGLGGSDIWMSTRTPSGKEAP